MKMKIISAEKAAAAAAAASSGENALKALIVSAVNAKNGGSVEKPISYVSFNGSSWRKGELIDKRQKSSSSARRFYISPLHSVDHRCLSISQ